MKLLLGLILLSSSLALSPSGTELACIFQTSFVDEVNTAEVVILRKDHGDVAQAILDQSPGPLNLNPLRWTHNEQLQQGLLIYWDAPNFDIDQVLQARAQILLTPTPFILPGFGPYGDDAVAVPLVCLAWETKIEDAGHFNIQTRALARQDILQQRPRTANATRSTEMACIMQTDVELEMNSDFLPRWVADQDDIALQILEQATGVVPLPNLLMHTSTDQWRDGMLVYWLSELDLPTLMMGREQILLNRYTFPGMGALLSDAHGMPQVCAVWDEGIENKSFFITTRANIRSTLLPPTVAPLP